MIVVTAVKRGDSASGDRHSGGGNGDCCGYMMAVVVTVVERGNSCVER
jgi:hypothetical protein